MLRLWWLSQWQMMHDPCLVFCSKWLLLESSRGGGEVVKEWWWRWRDPDGFDIPFSHSTTHTWTYNIFTIYISFTLDSYKAISLDFLPCSPLLRCHVISRLISQNDEEKSKKKDGKQKLTYELEHESKERQRCLWGVEDGRRPALGTIWWRNRWCHKKRID